MGVFPELEPDVWAWGPNAAGPAAGLVGGSLEHAEAGWVCLGRSAERLLRARAGRRMTETYHSQLGFNEGSVGTLVWLSRGLEFPGMWP